jgi:hypothetical protein
MPYEARLQSASQLQNALAKPQVPHKVGGIGGSGSLVLRDSCYFARIVTVAPQCGPIWAKGHYLQPAKLVKLPRD